MREKFALRTKIVAAALAAVLVGTLIPPGSIPSATSYGAEDMVLSEETYYHMDLGVQCAYTGEEWEGYAYSSSNNQDLSASINMGRDIEVVGAYNMDDSYWNMDNFSSNVSSEDYDGHTKKHISTGITNITASAVGTNINFSYKAVMYAVKPLDVGLQYSNPNVVWQCFGGESNCTNPIVKGAIDNAFEQYANETQGENHLYLVFCPVVIEYKIYVPKVAGELRAALDVPASVKTGEEFNVADASDIDESLTVTAATLEKKVGSGEFEIVETWDGTGIAGENTGGSIEQSCDEICTLTYKLTVHSADGQTAAATKSVTVNDGREIDGAAELDLPAFTYEGHTVIATDRSTFTVDGEDYSAQRAYAEDVATNDFKIVQSGAGTCNQINDTKASMMFYHAGNYTGQLKIKFGTKALTDTKPIEVRKTPYIEDNLGGFQKQNRKQTLEIAVATYPGKPITDFDITIKDKVTNQSVVFTPDNLQENTATIKTRTLTKTESDDGCWTYFTVEFLTKTPVYNSSNLDLVNEFSYKINVTDSKGDTDDASDSFNVVPDRPPLAEISIQDTFLRENKSNDAIISVEDISSTDGDQLSRVWYTANRNPLNSSQSLGFNPVITQSGYKDNSFGTKQNIEYIKTGVGKFDVRLIVKDVWIEPTLEEYVTADDYLSDEIIVTSTVENVAPVVSISPMFYDEAEVVLLADTNSYVDTKNKVNGLRKDFIENGIDAKISVVKTASAYNNTSGKVFSRIGRLNWTLGVGSCGLCALNETCTFDINNIYRIASAGTVVASNGRLSCSGYHTIYAMKEATSGEAYLTDATSPKDGKLHDIWKFTVTESSSYSMQTDSQGKYLYILCRDISKTIILNAKTGARIATVPFLLPSGTAYLSESEDRAYYITGDYIQKLDFNTMQLTNISKGGSLARFYEGKIMFVEKIDESNFNIVKFDINNENIIREKLPVLPQSSALTGINKYEWDERPSSTFPIAMDNQGHVVFSQYFRDNKDTMIRTIWETDYTTQNIKQYDVTGRDLDKVVYTYVPDETGTTKAVLVAIYDDTHTSSNSSYRYVLNAYTIGASGVTENAKNIVTKTNGYYNDINYAKYNSAEGRTILYLDGEYQHSDFGGTSLGQCIVLDSNNNTISTSGVSGVDVGDERISSNGYFVHTSGFYNIMHKETDILKGIYKVSLTADAAKKQALATYVNESGKNADVTQMITKSSPLNSGKLITDVKTSIEKKKKIKISVNGTSGTISKVFTFDPAKTYYCDYNIKPLKEDTAAGNITNSLAFSKSTAKTKANGDEFKVEKQYKEDFGDTNVDPFFTFSNMGGFSSGFYSGGGTVTFTIPANTKGVLSFKYDAYNYRDAGGAQNFKIDGAGWQKNLVTTSVAHSGIYTHGKLLGPGTHTLTISGQEDGYVGMDDLVVNLVKYDNNFVVMNNDTGGTTQTYTIPNSGTYKVNLYGPSCDKGGGLVKCTMTLKKGDVVKTYLGPQNIRATRLHDGANGVNGNGYGDSGTHKAQLYVNNKLVMVAGGSGSDGNPGVGDGLWVERGSYKVYTDPWGRKKKTLYYEIFNGTGGAGGISGVAGNKTVGVGAAGGPGAASYQITPSARSSSSQYDLYLEAGAGGKGGNGGASWADTSVCKSVSYVAGGSSSISKAELIKVTTAAPYSNEKVLYSEQTNNGWTSGSLVINTPTTALSYTRLDTSKNIFDADKKLSSQYMSYSNGGMVGYDEKLGITIPSGYTSLFNSANSTWAVGNRCNNKKVYLTFGTASGEYTQEPNKNGHNQYSMVPAPYTLYCNPMTGSFTETSSGANSSDPNRGYNIRHYLKNTTCYYIKTSDYNYLKKNNSYVLNNDMVYFLNETYNGKGTLTIKINNASNGVGEYLIDKLDIYYLQNGKKVYVSGTIKNLDNFSSWSKSSNVSISNSVNISEDEEEETSIIYKKGQLVGYHVFYSDYEADPKNEPKSYWIYSHTPFNDGEHSQAAIIYDEDGTIVKVCGKTIAQLKAEGKITGDSVTIEQAVQIAKGYGTYTLSESIPKFYIDGKYTVYHWTYDDTTRGTKAGGNPLWDKPSNTAEITFYIEGGATAPWITSINTVNSAKSNITVLENDRFGIKIGVDDAEKDVLSLTTEVYKDKQLIFTHRQKNIAANATTGIYPFVYTGLLPTAASPGKYEVVCTVRDATGAGLGQHKFTVISQGNIEGDVYHTDAWNANRKRFNLSYFGDEVNRDYLFATYLAITDRPRPRGTNIFWSGEKFILSADVAGSPTLVTCQIKNYVYSCNMVNSGTKTVNNEWIFTGDISHSSMINKWGNDAPEKLTFVFTANYAGGTTKTHEVDVVIDNTVSYRQIHRVF